MKKNIYRIIVLLLILLIVFIFLRLHIFPSKQNELANYGAGEYYFTLKHDGITREFVVYVPEMYNQLVSIPLVFMFHGGGGTMEHARTQTNLDAIADREGFIVVYAQGVSNPLVRLLGKSSGSWNAGPVGGGYAYKRGIDDVGFVDDMLLFLENRFTIDTDRIYATGFSMGGMLTYRLACERSAVFAAVAPVGTNMALVPDMCEPSRPVPLIHFHGKKDRLIPFFGGNTDSGIPRAFVVGGPYTEVQSTIDFWIEKNVCTNIPTYTYTKGEASCVEYVGCTDNVSVSLCTAENSGHTWPGGTVVNTSEDWAGYVGNTTNDMSANELMWTFFARHTLP